MSTKDRPVHFAHGLISLCGMMNPSYASYSNLKKNVTCKRCLKAIKKGKKWSTVKEQS